MAVALYAVLQSHRRRLLELPVQIRARYSVSDADAFKVMNVVDVARLSPLCASLAFVHRAYQPWRR